MDPMMVKMTMLCAVSATLRPMTTTLSQSGGSGMFFRRHSARSRATFWAGVSPGGPGLLLGIEGIVEPFLGACLAPLPAALLGRGGDGFEWA